MRNAEPILIYLLCTGDLYGSERMALSTVQGLTNYPLRVVFAAQSNGNGSAIEAAQAAGFETAVYYGRKQLIRRLVPYFLRHRVVDIIGVGVEGAFVCHVLARLMRVRLRQLVVAHGGVEEWSAYASKPKLGKIGVRTVAVSAFVRDRLIANGVRADAISVIENFMSDDQRAQCRQRAPYDSSREGARPLDSRKVRVAIVSRAHPIKRLDLVVEAVEKHGLAEFEFDVYGTGEELASLQSRAVNFPNLRFHGFALDVKQRLADADFFLHACPVEPFGLVVLEAAVSGVVVIVPNAGGAGSLIEPGTTGLHFLADDPDDLTRALREAAALPGHALQRLADNGRRAVDNRFAPRVGWAKYSQALADPVEARR